MLKNRRALGPWFQRRLRIVWTKFGVHSGWLWRVWVSDSGLSDFRIRSVMVVRSSGSEEEMVEADFGGVMKLVNVEVLLDSFIMRMQLHTGWLIQDHPFMHIWLSQPICPPMLLFTRNKCTH